MPQQYPPDEFDGITDSDRRGTHREKSARLGGVSSIVFVSIVVVVVVLLGIAVVNIVNSGKAGPSDQSAIAGSGKTSAADKSAGSGKSGSGKSGKPSKGAKKSKSPAAPVDKSQAVQVLNSTSTAGLAASASDVLRGDDWTVGTVGNYRSPEETTTVYYRSADLKSTARAVAKALGVTATEQSTKFNADVTVVLGPDYSSDQ